VPIRQRIARDVEATRQRAATRFYTLEINGEHASASGILTISSLQWFDHKDEGQIRGWHNATSARGSPYIKHWVPGLQIGYEHTFIHQFADFVQALGTANPAPDVPRRPGHRLRDRRGARIGEEREVRRRRIAAAGRSDGIRELD
jgi:hypothetical protein